MPTFGLSKVVPVVADADGRLVALAQAESLRDARGAAVKKRHVRLGQVLSTSMAGNDLLSSCLYTGGVVAQVAGPLAPVCLACLALLLFCYRAIYSEVVTAIPVNGGSYNGLLNVSPKRVAAVAAVLSMLTYIATAVVSGVDSMQYLAILWPGLDIRAATIILLAAFACLATLGVGESAFVAVAMFALHLSMMTVIIISSVVFAFKDSWVLFADNWRQPFPDIFNSTTGTLIVAGNAGTAIFFGYCLSALGITGFETAANFVEEMADNRTYVYTLRNLWILVSVFNPLLSLSAMMVVPMAVIYSHPSDLLAIVGFKAGGAGMQTFVCVDAVVVLAGAVLTSYVGVIGLFSRLSADGILPAFMRRLNTLRGTPHWTILIFFLASTSLFLAIYSPTDTNAIVQLGGVYSISFLSVMAAFAVCNLLLKAQRADMPRLVIARPWVVTLGMVMVVTGLVGNIIIGPEILVWFIIYVLALGFVVVVMFNKANLLRIAIVAVQSAWSSTAQRRAQAAHDAELRAAHDATEQRKLESQQEGHENVVGLPAFIGESPDAHHKKKRKHRKGSIVGGFFDDEEDDFTDDDDGGNDTSAAAAAADSASAADGASTHGGTRVDLHVTSRESSGTMRAASLAALSGAGSPLATDGGADNGSAAGATPVVATALSGWLEKSRQGLSRASSTRKLLTTPASGGGGGGGSGAGSVGSPLGPASPIASSAVAVASPTSAGNGDSGFQASPTRADRPMSAIVLATMHAAAAAKRVGSPLHDSVGVIASHAAVSGATAADAPLASAGGGGAPDAVVRAPSPALRPLEIPHAGAGALAVIAANDPAAAAGAGVAAVPATPLSGGPPPGIGAASAPSAARATSALGSISGIMEEPELEPLELNDSSAAPRSTARRDAIVNVRPARTNKRARDGTRDIDPKSMRGRIIAWLKQRLNYILDAPVVYLAKHNDLFTLNDAIEYVRDNELSTHIVIVHFVDDLSDVIKIVEKKIGEETERARIAAVAEAAAAAARRAAAAASSGSKEVTALSESKKAKAAEAAGAGAAGGIGKPSAATHSLSVVGMVGTAVNSAASAAVAAVSSAAASAAVVSSAKTPAPPQHSPTLRALPAASPATPQTHGDGKNGGGRGASGVSALAAAAASAASASKAAAAASRMATSPAAAMAAADAAQQAALAAAGAAEAAVAAAQAAELALEAQERGLPTAGAILAQLPPLTLEAQLLQNNIALLDAVHTDMRIDSLIVRGTCFSPEALAWLVEYLRVLPGMVLISSPDVAFPFQVSALGGVRVINRSAMREDRDLSLSRLKRIIHKTAADLRMHTVEDDDDDDDGDFDGDGGPSSASFAATLPNTPQRVVRRRAVA